jgi:hypothetical protein
MTVDAVQTAVSTHVAQDYETLRTAALGEGLAFDARNGLALFLRRGMWGWAQATHDHGERLEPAKPVHSGAVVEDHHKQIVQLFAAIATSFAAGRNHERSS